MPVTPFVPGVGSGERSPIEEAFWRFHAANPSVYELLVKLARLVHERGRKKIGIGMLFEVVRWEHAMDTLSDDQFRLNNNYRALYARLIMASNPELDGLFDIRQLHGGDEPFGQAPLAEPVGHVNP